MSTTKNALKQMFPLDNVLSQFSSLRLICKLQRSTEMFVSCIIAEIEQPNSKVKKNMTMKWGSQNLN